MISARARRRIGTTVVALSVLLLGAGAALTASRATAVFQSLAENGHPGYLVLGLDSSTPLWATLSPGQSAHWLVQAALHDTDIGDLELELEVRDALPEASGLAAEVTACDGSFDLGGAQPSCHSGLQVVMPSTDIALFAPNSGRFSLPELRHDAPRQLLVTLSLPATADPTVVEGQQLARVGLGVHVRGETPDVEQPAEPELPLTGSDLLPLGMLAVGLLGVGIGVLLRRRREVDA